MRIRELFFLSLLFLTMNSGMAQNHLLHFDGMNDYVNLGSDAGDGIRSIELWFRSDIEIGPDNMERYTMTTRNSDGQHGEFGIFIGYDFMGEQGRVTFTRQVGSEFYYVYSDHNSWEANRWYHVAGVIDPGEGMKLYIDGVLQQDSDPSTSPTEDENEITTLACWGDKYERWFEGDIDEVRIWKRALSAEEILEHMCDSIDPGSSDNLWCYYRMEEGTGSTLINYGEEASGGSIQGAIYGQDFICSSFYSPDPLWLKGIHGSQDDEGLDITVDGTGNPICCGYFTSETLYAGDMSLAREAYCDAYVIKYDFWGNPVWMDNPGGSTHQEAHGIRADQDDNIYVTGFFKGNFQFAGTELEATADEDAFLIKYDKDGNELWGIAMHCQGVAEGREIVLDKDGNIIVGFRFSDSDLNIADTSLQNEGSLDVAIAKFNPEGELLWARSYGGNDLDFIMGLCVDIEGRIYFTGGFHSSVIDLGNYHFINTSDKRAAIIVQLSADGQVMWAENHSDGYDQQFMAIVVDSNFNIYSGGYFKGDFIFGSELITNAAGHFDVFLAKYNANHEHQWIKKISSDDYERTDALVLGNNGHVFLEVVTFGDLNFGNTTVINNGERDLAIAEYNPAGEVQWVLHAGGEDNDRSFGMAGGPFGNLYFTGYFYSQQLKIGNQQISNQGGMDSYIAALGPGCPPPNPTFYYNVEDLSVQFTPNGTANSYYWDFGDGDTSTYMNPIHVYDSMGTYTVCLSVTNDCGQETDCQEVSICADPTADFYYYINGLELSFFQQSALAEDYQWDFGDGTHSYEPNPVHTYDEEGNYIVSLIVFNVCGADQHFDTIYLLLPMMCNFNFTVDENGVVHFQDESLDAMSCFWDFGDGGTSTEQNPVHQYEANGTYNCCLTIENDEGTYSYCTDVIVDTYEEPVELNIYFSSGSKSIKFEIPEDGQYKIRMFDLKGNPVYTNELDLKGGSTFELGTSTLPMGVYVIELSSVNIFERIKIMVSQL